jgi:hypothetical protein
VIIIAYDTSTLIALVINWRQRPFLRNTRITPSKAAKFHPKVLKFLARNVHLSLPVVDSVRSGFGLVFHCNETLHVRKEIFMFIFFRIICAYCYLNPWLFVSGCVPQSTSDCAPTVATAATTTVSSIPATAITIR